MEREYTKEELNKLICELYSIPKITPLIRKQINKFVLELGLSYKEIAQALYFFIEVEKREPELKYGIGIVPHTLADAKNYFKKLKKQKEEQIKSVKIANSKPDIILQVTHIKKRAKNKTIDIESLNDEDSD